MFLYTYGIRAEKCSISTFFDALWLFYPQGETSIDLKNKFPLFTENEILLRLWGTSSTISDAKQMFTDFLSDARAKDGW